MEIVQGYSGLWTTATPFSLPDIILECSGIVSIGSLESMGFNVFSTVYSPVGLNKEDYDADKADAVKIVTLVDQGGQTHYVPDKYISAVPRYKVIPYSRLMIGIDSGVCYDGIDIETLKAELKLVADRHLGLNTEVYESRIPSDVIVDEGRHKELETARQANIKFDVNALTELESVNKELNEKITRIAYLESIIAQLQT